MMQLPRRNTWIQILFWGALWVLVPILLSGGRLEFSDRLLVRSVVILTGIALVIWVNLEVLLPKLYFNKKQAAYVLTVIGMLILIPALVHSDLMPWAGYFNRPGGGGGGRGGGGWHTMRYFGMVMPYFTSLLGSALFEMASFANRKEKEATEFRSEKLEAELKFLKSQINPHFLFNALNNIYTLTVIKSDKAPENLLKLSGMLRYMLYDCKADQVPLGKEIEYLRHFIDLHLLKDSRGLNVDVQLDESRPNRTIAPMLFIPFVENAFKHSKVEDREKGWIRIRLQTTDEHLVFEVENSVPEQQFTKDEAGGIGLNNVRRQLELLYPDRHELDIEPGPEVYKIRLKLFWS
ncbi:MAG: histidine kinase [Bacteroidetes bacterium]|nr:MAG: histidine kinase [Bacteroidota bacterium]